MVPKKDYFLIYLLSGHNFSSTCCCDQNCLLGWWFLFYLPMGICCWIHSFHDDYISWIYCSTIWQIHSIARGRTKNWNRTVGCQYWLSTLQVICCRRFKKVKMFRTINLILCLAKECHPVQGRSLAIKKSVPSCRSWNQRN